MRANEWLEAIARVIKETSGFYGFAVDGEEYVILRKADFDRKKNETQLSLDSVKRERENEIEREIMRANEVLEGYRLQRAADSEEENGFEYGEEKPSEFPIELGGEEAEFLAGVARDDGEGRVMRVRFEPLRGDLPPELQE